MIITIVTTRVILGIVFLIIVFAAITVILNTKKK